MNQAHEARLKNFPSNGLSKAAMWSNQWITGPQELQGFSNESKANRRQCSLVFQINWHAALWKELTCLHWLCWKVQSCFFVPRLNQVATLSSCTSSQPRTFPENWQIWSLLTSTVSAPFTHRHSCFHKLVSLRSKARYERNLTCM